MNRTTAIQIKPAEVTEDRVLRKPAVFQVYVPKTYFNHRGIKWLDDSLVRLTIVRGRRETDDREGSIPNVHSTD